jgi:zinc/manganese transport system permease protein
MTGIHDVLWAAVSPFHDYAFMRRALMAAVALALGSGPVGVFLVLRRMSLMGDAMAHAVLPGAAIGYLIAGMSLPAMSVGGFIAGLVVALLSGLATRFTRVTEDANFAAFFLISLSLGVLLISVRGSAVDSTHVLFGNILGVDDQSLYLVGGVATFSLLAFAVILRPLALECFDPGYLRVVSGSGGVWHLIFLVLVVVNMVAGFQALGTIMAVGLMMLPAISARLWARGLGTTLLAAVGIALISGYGGLLLSFYANWPSGPAIVLTAGVVHMASLIVGTNGALTRRFVRQRHLKG